MDSQVLFFISFSIYAIILIGISFFLGRSTDSSFILGNRAVPYWITAIATQASDMSSWLFLGFPAMVFMRGVFECWTAIGLVVFMYITWHYIAPKLRQKTAYYNCSTLPAYFEAATDSKSLMLRLVSSCIMLLFFIFYSASFIVALGRVFQAAFGISYHLGTILGLLTGLAYTVIGGFVAVAWCNMIQGIFLLFGIVLVAVYALYNVGIQAVQQALISRELPLSLVSSPKDLLQAFFLAIGWGIGYFGQPHILVNFMAIDDPKNIPYAKYIGISWQITALFSAVLIGLVGSAYFTLGSINPELLFVDLSKLLFPPLIAGFLLCAIIAATLSSLDGQILLSGSILAHDIYASLCTKTIADNKKIVVARIGSIVVSCCALAIAWGNNASVYNLVNYAWSGLGAAFGPAILVSLYKSHVTSKQLLISMLVGTCVVSIWPYYNTTILPLVPGFFASLVSLLLPFY